MRQIVVEHGKSLCPTLHLHRYSTSPFTLSVKMDYKFHLHLYSCIRNRHTCCRNTSSTKLVFRKELKSQSSTKMQKELGGGGIYWRWRQLNVLFYFWQISRDVVFSYYIESYRFKKNTRWLDADDDQVPAVYSIHKIPTAGFTFHAYFILELQLLSIYKLILFFCMSEDNQ